jgi:hypothetical protein
VKYCCGFPLYRMRLPRAPRSNFRIRETSQTRGMACCNMTTDDCPFSRMCFGDLSWALVDCVLACHDGSTRLVPPAAGTAPHRSRIGPGPFGSRLGSPATSGIPQRPFTGRMEGKQPRTSTRACGNSQAP